MNRHFLLLLLLFEFSANSLFSQYKVVPPSVDLRMYELIRQISPERIRKDIITLAAFGTRNLYSDTISETRGIGAATRWIKNQFDSISRQSKSGLQVFYQNNPVRKGKNSRILRDVPVKNVIAILPGTVYPDHYIIISGDIDSRASDVNDSVSEAPGANDNASGVAAVLETARILSKYQFNSSIVFAALSGEEHGLLGGEGFAAYARQKGWHVIGILNNDMIGNIQGIDGTITNRSFRIFAEPVSATETAAQARLRRFTGGETDGVSVQLARYVCRLTGMYMPEMKPVMIYRLDRFGRGGHHKPFNDAGYAGIRIMEAAENYNRQHQDIRTEDGIDYGDVVSGVNFEYAARLAAVNTITLAGLARAPLPPENVRIGGAAKPSTTLSWKMPDDSVCTGFKIYWRETTSPQWQYSRYIDKVSTFTLENTIVDNYFFGVASVGIDGNESIAVFPSEMIKE